MSTAAATRRQRLLDLLLADEGVQRAEEGGISRRPHPAEPAPLSYSQERLWLLDQVTPGDPAYHVPAALRVEGAFHHSRLVETLADLVRRHEVLRTTFRLEGGEPRQRVGEAYRLPLPVVDLSGLSDPGGPASTRLPEVAGKLARREVRRPFDLGRGPLLRGAVIRLGPKDHILLLTQHHIVSDRWSREILSSELAALYLGRVAGSPPELPELPIAYADFAAWQREGGGAETLDEQTEYWRRRLASLPDLALPTDRPRPSVLDTVGGRVRFELGRETASALRRLAGGRGPGAKGATLFMVLSALFRALLRRWSGQRDFALGTPVAGRGRDELEGLLGFFTNTLVLRDDPAGAAPESLSFADLVERERETVLAAFDHQDLPFDRLLGELPVERDLSRSPLFQAVVVLQNVPPRPSAAPAGGAAGEEIRVSPFLLDDGTAKFELTLLFEDGPELAGVLEYNSELFDRTTAERLVQHLQRLAAGVTAAPERRPAEIDTLPAAERHRLLVEPGTVSPPAASETASAGAAAGPEAVLPDLFARQAAARPEAAALVSGEEYLSYGELDRRSAALAARLAGLGVGPETRVALYLEPGPDQVTALLAVLRAGGAYVPIDPAYPERRTAFLLADSRARLLLTTSGPAADLPPSEAEILLLDQDPPAVDAATASSPAAPLPGNAAYVIYTSGSTGEPKGVVVRHREVARLFTSTEGWFGFGAGDSWSFFHSYAFDFSVWEMWGALAYGGRLVVVPPAVRRSPEAFLRLLAERRVTVLNQTPVAFEQLSRAEAEAAAPAASPPLAALRWVIFGGDALRPSSLAGWFDRHGDRQPRLVNMYGITETTVHVTYRPMERRDLGYGPGSPVGTAIPDLRLLVLDASRGLEPAPLGVPGEIFVGGPGLARGYLDRPRITAERFLPDPYPSLPEAGGGRLYRTGDLGRLRPEGGVDHLGRVDRQVKVRGFRIEPGEIQAALVEHPAVGEAAVIARPAASGTSAVLAAYLTPAEAGADTARAELARADLGSFLRRSLPEHMVPAAFVVLERLPLTAHGKLDREALPAPSEAEARAGEDRPYRPPEGPVQEALAAVWGHALEVDRVGAEDGFFDLGGDSIRAVRVVALARERGLTVSVQDLFRFPRLSALAGQVEGSGGTDEAAAGDGGRPGPFDLLSAADREAVRADAEAVGEELEDAYPLTNLQVGMIYHMDLSTETPLYHNVNSYALEMPFDEAAFRRAVAAVVERHPILRSSFDLTRYSEPIQKVHRRGEMDIRVEDLRGLGEDEQREALLALREQERAFRFDLSRPPLLRFHVQRLSDEVVQLTLTELHAILDGWSLQSTLAEIFENYRALEAGGPLPLREELASSFRQFVHLEKQAAASEASRRFWRESLAGYRVLELPGRPPSLPGSAGGTRAGRPDGPREVYGETPISAELSGGLQARARELAVPIKNVLMAAHFKVLSELSGQRDVLGGLAANGRPEEPDGEKVRGLFLNTLPFRLRLEPGTWNDLVRRVQAREVELLPHRRYPLGSIQEWAGRRPLFETQFNYVHFHVLDEAERSLKAVEALANLNSEETHFAVTAGFGTSVRSGAVYLNLHLDRHVFDDAQVEALARAYLKALEAVAFDGEARHDEAVLFPPAPVAAFDPSVVPAPAPGDRFQVIGPAGAWDRGGLLREAREAGAAVEHLPEPLTGGEAAGRLAATLRRGGATNLLMPAAWAGTLLAALLSGAESGEAAPPTLRRVLLGGERGLPPALRMRLAAALGAEVWEVHELTEGGAATESGGLRLLRRTAPPEGGDPERALAEAAASEAGRAALLAGWKPSRPGALRLAGPFLSDAPERAVGELRTAEGRGTGLLARSWGDAGLELLGPAGELPIREGMRLDLAFAEAVLTTAPEVADALVVPLPGKGASEAGGEGAPARPRLAAYVVPAAGEEGAWEGPARRAAAGLGDALGPRDFMAVAAFPVGADGRLDREALPTPRPTLPAGAGSPEAPTSELERTLARVWAEVLGVEVGLHDNFFDLGGTSVRMLQAHRRVGEALGREVDLMAHFRYPTVYLLAEHLRAAAEGAAGPSFEETEARGEERRRALERRRRRRRRRGEAADESGDGGGDP